MHTSYFLFVMVITMFCYAVIKGRPSKLRQSNPEFCPEKVSSGWGLTQHCTRRSQLVLIPFIVGDSFPPVKLLPVFLSAVISPQPQLWCCIFNHIPRPQLGKKCSLIPTGKRLTLRAASPPIPRAWEVTSQNALPGFQTHNAVSQHSGSAGSAASCRRLGFLFIPS